MKALALVPGTTDIKLVDRPEPQLHNDDDIKLRVLRVGICGTDRDEAAGGRAKPPDGSSDLVLGHEMFGQVVQVGKAVQRVKPGDYAVFTVRRGCGKCLPCSMNRSDMCLTGDYHERGIWGLDGYQCEFVVDREAYVVQVPKELEPVGVLTEPMSVAAKAIYEVLQVQNSRLPDAPATPNWLHGRRCLVAGLGPIGLLAAIALRLRGAEVCGLDVVDVASMRPQWLKKIGGSYIDGRKVSTQQLADRGGPFEIIFEATGVATLEFNLLDALATNGAYVLTGIPMGERPVQVPGAELLRGVVLKNQAMLGSVNAARDHYQSAVDDLARAYLLWGEHITALITNRHKYTDAAAAFHQHAADEIKAVVEWS